ncbi:MAG: ATP-binding cassette domain-containing protein [Clostridia bacterium]|nr:ATP-binding cassette domain-containing protein [Clostridia bacterium]
MGLKIENVTKTFIDKKAVDDISFEISKPGVFALLGTNGAGKTTTIRMMLGIIKKDTGNITWNGKAVDRKSVNFGYLPEERGLYPKSKIVDQLMYFAKLKGMKKADAEKNIDYWLERLKMTEYKNSLAEKLSKGNQQKIQFIIAVMHNPDLVVLDEPFSGLDPVNTDLLKDVILELVEKGKYIVMSSHQMNSVEEFCDDIVILSRGKTVLKGNLNEIKSVYPKNKLEIDTKEDITKVIDNLKVKEHNRNKYIIQIENEKQAEEILETLVAKKVKVEKYEILKPTLHEIFIEKVGE